MRANGQRFARHGLAAESAMICRSSATEATRDSRGFQQFNACGSTQPRVRSYVCFRCSLVILEPVLPDYLIGLWRCGVA